MIARGTLAGRHDAPQRWPDPPKRNASRYTLCLCMRASERAPLQYVSTDCMVNGELAM